MARIELRVERQTEGEAPAGWLGRWLVNGAAVGSQVQVSADVAQRLAADGRRFLALFEQGGLPWVPPGQLAALGSELARLWVNPVRADLDAHLSAGAGHDLVVSSADPEVLDLPWELVPFLEHLPVGCDAAWVLRREVLPAAGAPPPLAPAPLAGGPLRILFLASSPDDQHPLDLEREEDVVLRATERLQGDVVVQIAEIGTFEELRLLNVRVKPQVIHLSGHGNVNDEGEGVFAFETDEGATDLKSARQIAEAVARGSSVQLFVVNACKSAQAGAAGLCRSLAAAGIPHALGWAASVGDQVATDFASSLYGELLAGAPVGRAVAHARLQLRDHGRVETQEGELLDASFALPQLYGRGGGELVNFSLPRVKYEGPRTAHDLLGDGIKGLKEGFVGRRRDVWKVLKAMRHGDPSVALLWGLGGAGKSTLATRVASHLKKENFRVLAVRAPDGKDPVVVGRETYDKLISAFERAFETAQREDLLASLRSERLSVESRLRSAVEGLNELRVLFVLDNLEGIVDLATRQVVDPQLAFLLKLLATDLTGGSRLLLTCRYQIADLSGVLGGLGSGVFGLELKDFREADIRKFFRRDPKVEARLHHGEIPLALFDRLANELGGTPRFLETARKVLRTAKAEDLLADLDGLSPGLLSQKRQEYLEQILAKRLYEALSPRAQEIASRLALSELPLPADGVARIAECGLNEAHSALREGVAYGLLQLFQIEEEDQPDLFHPPGLLRPWLIEVGLDEARSQETHALLADFWRQTYESHRETELRVSIDTGLLACRFHAAAGGERQAFVWATVKLGWRLQKRAEWRTARALLEEIPEDERDFAALTLLARLEHDLGDYPAAREHFAAALALPEKSLEEEAFAWHHLGSIDMREGSYGTAREKLGKALAIRQSIGGRSGEAATWHQLGSINAKEGSYGTAREKLGKALAILQSIGDRSGEAATLANLGSIDLEVGSYGTAREKLGKSLKILKSIGDRSGEAAMWHQLGTIDMKVGSYGTARENFEKSLEVKQSIGDRSGEAATWHQLGSIDLYEGSYGWAREKFEKSLEIKQSIGDRSGEARTWHQLGSINMQQGSHGTAREKFEKSLEIKQSIGDRSGEAATWHQLGTIDVEEGSYGTAREKLGKALTIRQSIGDRYGEGATFNQLGMIAVKRGRLAAGAPLVALCYVIGASLGHGDAQSDLKTLLGICQKLNYGEAEIKALLTHVQAEYARDRGKTLVEQAFAEE